MGKRFLNTVLAAILLCFCLTGQAQKVSRQTYIFAVKGTDTLRVDKYASVGSKTDTITRPVVLFAFGGGFKGGSRSGKQITPYFMHLVRSGFVVVSTDYRTALKNANPSSLTSLSGFATALRQAVGTAVEDYIDATAFVISQSKAWKINPAQIIACGSSAGAITVLQAENMICNSDPLAAKLPPNFNYAGVISFAGAVCALGEPQWGTHPCPLMLFHGNADSMVPFNKAVVGNMGLWGSAYIASQFKEKSWPFWFVKVEGAGHEMATKPMTENRADVVKFIKEFALGHKTDCVETVRTIPGKTGYKTDFTIEDYIRENMKP